jgi:hypothetical protein
MFGRNSDETHDETQDERQIGRHEADAGTRGEVVAREREEHGGIKIGSAFFGWLAATGMALLLSALVAVTGLLAGEATGNETATEISDALDIQVDSLGVLGVVVALAIMFVAYYSGGYVAGRMSRFDGARQGVGAWLIGLIVTIVLAVVGAVLGSEYNVLERLDLPALPVGDSELATGGAIALVLALVVTLLAAIGGGKAGERYHRKIDRTGFEA